MPSTNSGEPLSRAPEIIHRVHPFAGARRGEGLDARLAEAFRFERLPAHVRHVPQGGIARDRGGGGAGQRQANHQSERGRSVSAHERNVDQTRVHSRGVNLLRSIPFARFGFVVHAGAVGRDTGQGRWAARGSCHRRSEHSPFARPPRSKLRGIRAKRPLRGPGSWNRREERSKLRGMDPSAIQKFSVVAKLHLRTCRLKVAWMRFFYGEWSKRIRRVRPAEDGCIFGPGAAPPARPTSDRWGRWSTVVDQSLRFFTTDCKMRSSATAQNVSSRSDACRDYGIVGICEDQGTEVCWVWAVIGNQTRISFAPRWHQA